MQHFAIGPIQNLWFRHLRSMQAGVHRENLTRECCGLHQDAKSSEENTLTCELCEAECELLLCRLKGAEPHSDVIVATIRLSPRRVKIERIRSERRRPALRV